MSTIISGKSMDNRIEFSTIAYSSQAIRDENGKIKVKTFTKSMNRPENYKENVVFDEKETHLTNLLYSISFSVLFFKIFAFRLFIANTSPFVFLYLIPALLFLVTTVVSISFIFKHNELRKNHAAEHMVFAAYRDLGRVPKVEEARRYSRFSTSCGISTLSAIITSQIIGFLVYYFTGYYIAEFILIVVSFICPRLMPLPLLGLLGQFFTTAKPDDSNLQLAIKAIKALRKKTKNSTNKRELDLMSSMRIK